MDKGQILSTIVVSIIAALGAYLAAKASGKASTKNTATSSRVEMEKEAYERARALDVATIDRQDRRIQELEEEANETEVELLQLHHANDQLSRRSEGLALDNSRLRELMYDLQLRVTRVQRGMNPDSTEKIRMRETDTNPILPEAKNGRE